MTPSWVIEAPTTPEGLETVTAMPVPVSMVPVASFTSVDVFLGSE